VKRTSWTGRLMGEGGDLALEGVMKKCRKTCTVHANTRNWGNGKGKSVLEKKKTDSTLAGEFYYSTGRGRETPRETKNREWSRLRGGRPN